MLFNSLDFAVFLPIVFVLYWFVTKHNLKLQNALIVASSYVFYGWWDWRFLSLIIFSTFLDYSIGCRLKNEENQKIRKTLLWTSIIVNLGFLGVFKYYNFFLENFIAAFSFFGQDIQPNSLNIILPVGISFYTFQTLSYTIDVYKKKLEPTEDLVAFSAFVCFFPQLVAGPIEKAIILLPQIESKRSFDFNHGKSGIWLVTYGMFKKIVIADNLAPIIDKFYATPSFSVVNLTEFIVSIFAYSIQIYCDFSGYSDIAIGVALLFGIKLSTNFKQPYFSSNAVEFWHRWHISLSTWFRDYVFIPLGGSKEGLTKNVRNILIVFLVSGLWHGAEWTFVIWGVGHFIYYFFDRFIIKNKSSSLISKLLCFVLVSILWIPFRATDTSQFLSLLLALPESSMFGIPFGKFVMIKLLFLLAAFISYEIYLSKKESPENLIFHTTFLIIISSIFGNFSHNAFVYFQF